MRSRVVFALAVAVLVGAFAAASAGGVTETYHGIFSDQVSYTADCTGVPSGGVIAEGVWNVAIHGAHATVTITIFTNGKHHVSYGTAAAVLKPGPNFQVEYPTGAGDLTMSLAGSAMTYTIAHYHLGGVVCPTGEVTYHGELR